MARPFNHVSHLIMATARKAFPFMVLAVGGVRGYFITRADAEAYISTEGQA